jgi:hypothetical protein
VLIAIAAYLLVFRQTVSAVGGYLIAPGSASLTPIRFQTVTNYARYQPANSPVGPGDPGFDSFVALALDSGQATNNPSYYPPPFLSDGGYY